MAVRADPVPSDGPVPWSQAWERAALGPGGFYSDPAHPGPGTHFRTSVHVGAVFCDAVATLLLEVDQSLGHPHRLDVVDVGAGRGELLVGLLDGLPEDVARRVAPVAIDVRRRPDGLDERVAWVQGIAPHAIPHGGRGLMVAHEWLDDVPLDVVEVDDVGRGRLVLVDPDGREVPGPTLTDDEGWAALGLDAAAARTWLARWWPVREPGERAEVGLPRDRHWAAAAGRLAAGTALAVDYGHLATGRPRRGSLAAYRGGALVPTAPDGSANLTAHVALDALAAATGGRLSTQRASLLRLGVDSRLPSSATASADPVGYAAALARASDASELLDPAGLGGHGWLRVDVGDG